MLPHFLCIGAQKAGTTWLYRNLQSHPSIWLPPVKEIHYFDQPSPWPLLLQAKRSGKVRELLWEQTRRSISLRNREEVSWSLRFFLLPRTDRWYASLFNPGAGQIAGDITPRYATLDSAKVRDLHGLMPGAKLIYLLRNPMDRIWSQAAMRFGRWQGRRVETVPREELRLFLDQPVTFRHSAYIQNLATWEEFFPRDQIFIGFFDQLVEDASALLKAIFVFLGVDDAVSIPMTVTENVNARRYSTMPPHVSTALAARCYDQLERLHERFANRYTAGWLESARECLKAD